MAVGREVPAAPAWSRKPCAARSEPQTQPLEQGCGLFEQAVGLKKIVGEIDGRAGQRFVLSRFCAVRSCCSQASPRAALWPCARRTVCARSSAKSRAYRPRSASRRRRRPGAPTRQRCAEPDRPPSSRDANSNVWNQGASGSPRCTRRSHPAARRWATLRSSPRNSIRLPCSRSAIDIRQEAIQHGALPAANDATNSRSSRQRA